MAGKKCSSVFMDEAPWPKETTEQLKIRGFEFEEKIGYGSFATVYKVNMTREGKTIQVACKMINLKTKSDRYREKFFPREIEATRTLKHRYIVHVYEVVKDSTGSFCFIFMQLAKSDLLKEMEVAPERKIGERQGRIWCQQMIEGLLFLHSNLWVHRDMKVENVLISPENTVLLSDFGFMRQQRPDVLSETHCGSLAYAAPEVVSPPPGAKKGGYDAYKADTWSFGVVLFVMHTGEMPFDDADSRKVTAQHKTVTKIVDGRSDLSDRLKTLIKGLLNTDPQKRMTLKQAQDDPWVKEKGGHKSVIGSIGSSIKHAVGSIVGSPGSKVNSKSSSLRMLSSSSSGSQKSAVHKSNASLALPKSSISSKSSSRYKSGSKSGSMAGSSSKSRTGSTSGSRTGSKSGSSTSSSSGSSKT